MNRRDLILMGLFSLTLPVGSFAKREDEEIKLLFPVTYKDRKRWKKVFRRIRGAINLWGAGVHIEVVAYDEGIAFVDKFENGEFAERIENLMLYGVEFKACAVAMKMFNVKKEDLIEGVQIVKSGFEYHVLKEREGYISIYL